MTRLLLALLLAAGPARAHEWLADIRVPSRPYAQCCNEHDCMPRDPCITSEGQPGLRITENRNACMAITDENLVVRRGSPDGLWWGCWWPADGPDVMRCVIPGSAG